MRYFESKIDRSIPQGQVPNLTREQLRGWFRARLKDRHAPRPLADSRTPEQRSNDEARRSESAVADARFVHRDDEALRGVVRLWVGDRVDELLLEGNRCAVVVAKLRREVRQVVAGGGLVVWPKNALAAFRANRNDGEGLQIHFALVSVTMRREKALRGRLKDLSDPTFFSQGDIYKVPSNSQNVARTHELDHMTFEQIADDHHPIVVGIARSFHAAHPELDLDDLIQTARITLWCASKSFPGGIPFRAYARGAIVKALLKHARTNRPWQNMQSLPADFEIASDDDPVASAVLAKDQIHEIAAMPGGTDVLRLAYGYKDRELGATSTERSRRSRLLKRLREAS